ncbi:MAG: efflux RND transporter periplasmic adaptor subunit [Nitrospirota bacterium]
MIPKKKILIPVAALVIVIITVLVVRSRNSGTADALVLSGNVEVTEVNVGFKIPGRVVRLLTDEGRPVKKGERAALLDSAEYESLAAQNRALVQNAGATLEKTKKDHERAEELYKNGAISSQQMDAAKTAYDVAAAQLLQARAALAASEDRLRDTAVYAPISGVVLRKNIEAGETIAAGTPVFTIGDLENPWVKVYVKEDKLGVVKLGQKAEIRTDSYPGKIYEGTVTYISSEAEFTPKNVQTQEERVKLVFAVKVSVKNVSNELKPGMPADVKILLK